MNARAKEAVCATVLISLALMLRMSALEAALFGVTLLLIYLPGYIIVNHIVKQKFEVVEAHLFSFALGASLISFASFAAIQLDLPIVPLTIIGVEVIVLFVLYNVFWINELRKKKIKRM